MSRSPLEEGIQKIIREFKLPVAFPKGVEVEANSLPGRIPPEEVDRRVDLRGEVVVTIDGENARDFDDAVSIRRREDGGWQLKVSIADVGFYVRGGSALDQEAAKRGTSTYFPDRCLPMLPEKLSNDLCSLVPHQDRLTFTVEMGFDREGKKESVRLYRSLIRSAERLTYTKVRRILVDRDPALRAGLSHLVPDLEQMGELAEKMQEVRRKRGGLDFDLPEPLIELDLEEGRIDRIVKAERNKAHRLIEEFMIAANESVAEFITERKRSMVYRVHGEPDPEKVRDFGILLSNLGHRFHLGRKVLPKTFSAIIAAVKGRKEERLVNTLLLRTMKQAFYDTKNVGHFGLASDCYTHFTSPIRRYPDLVVHRILANLLQQDGRNLQGGALLQKVAVHSSERERNSMKAEWASRDLAAACFMKGKIGEEYEGIISGVTRFGFFVELNPYFVEGLVSLRGLKGDFYYFDEKRHTLLGRRNKKRYQIGLTVKVRVEGVNLEKRWVDLTLLDF